MVQKYIIDKADIHNILTGKEIPLGQGSKARAFCVEIAGGMTNGEVIQEIYRFHSDMNCGSNGEYVHIWSNDGNCQMTIHKNFWNAPYKVESEE